MSKLGRNAEEQRKLDFEAGIKTLKRMMLDRLGVDTRDQFGSYNDTMTPSEKERSGNTYDKLKNIERQMKQDQRKSDDTYDERHQKFYKSGKEYKT